MIYNNINDILTLNKKETKFRHYHYNWVYMRRFVSGIRELAEMAGRPVSTDRLDNF